MTLFLERHPRLAPTLLFAGFLLLALLVYGGMLHAAFVRWDDGMLIYENPAIRHINLTTLRWIFTHYDPELYIPLTFFTYQINFLIGGIDPFTYKLFNLLLHTGSAFCVFLLARRLIGNTWAALCCGLLFLLHPLHTEAVLWASARKDVLSTLFFLMTIILYLRWHDTGKGAIASRPYGLSIVFFVLALLSKVMVLTLPIVLILFDLWQGRTITKQSLIEKIPYVALSVLFGIIGIFGKTGVLVSSSPWQKVLMAGKSIVFYLGKIVWPFHFSLLYPFNGDITLLSPAFAVPWGILIVLMAACVIGWGRGGIRSRPYILGFAFFLITVAPTLLNFAKGDMDLYFASDRYAYVPSIGIFLGIAAFIGRGEIGFRPYMDRVVAGICIAALLLLGFLSHRQSLVWRDTRTLFENVIRLYPDASYVAHNNLGNMERLRGNLDVAIVEYQRSLEIRRTPKTLSNLAATYRRLKQYDPAMKLYAEALTIDPQSPVAHFGLGIVQAERGDLVAAEHSYRTALSFDPTYEEVYVNLGALFAAQNNFAAAKDAYEKALSINPAIPQAEFNLGIAEHELGDDVQAIAAYERALDLDPRMIAARINLAILLYNSGDTEGAARQFTAVLAIDPENATALSALQQMGLRP